MKTTGAQGSMAGTNGAEVLHKSFFVIEADHETRVGIREVLEGEQHFVVSCANGAEALLLLQNISRPQLIILSGNIPLMSAQDLLNSLKLNPRVADVPILQIYSPAEPLLKGIWRSLQKPVEKYDLISLIAELK